jgi:hypothetical protein
MSLMRNLNNHYGKIKDPTAGALLVTAAAEIFYHYYTAQNA